MTRPYPSIPYVDLVRQNEELIDDVVERIRTVFQHGQFILGPEVEELETRLSEYLGVDHVIGVSSGTDALILALRAHGIGRGDEVVIPSHTFLATAAAVCAVDAEPVFADIDPRTMLISPESVELQITPRTKAVIPVHLNGYVCDMAPLEAIAQAHRLHVIEDAAQSIGARRSGRSAGSWGTGCFSLHPLKVLGACGDAGFITTHDPERAALLRRLRNIGLANRDEAAEISVNSRLDTLQAAVLLAKLPRLDDWIDARAAHARAYRAELPEGIQLPPEEENVRCVYSTFVVRIENDRDRIQKELGARGIETKIHYPIPVHQQQPYRRFARRPLPVTDRTAQSILSLPCSPELTADERDAIIAQIRELWS